MGCWRYKTSSASVAGLPRRCSRTRLSDCQIDILDIWIPAFLLEYLFPGWSNTALIDLRGRLVNGNAPYLSNSKFFRSSGFPISSFFHNVIHRRCPENLRSGCNAPPISEFHGDPWKLFVKNFRHEMQEPPLTACSKLDPVAPPGNL